jgi:membrane associated rhomboid family serine protease
MGIYDREYYRGWGSGSSWLGGIAPCCKALILINCIVFLLQNAVIVDRGFLENYLAASAEGIFERGRIWQLLTAAFLHAGILHILGNMWFLWLVGREIEGLYGSRDFLAFYLGAAVLSTLGWALIQWFSGRNHVMVGASGAVMAVVTLYTLYFPRREILLFFIPMPMWVLLGIYLLLPMAAGPESHVAYEAHLMGAGVAFCYKQFDLRWSRLVSGRFRRPRLKLFTPVPYDPSRVRGPAASRAGLERREDSRATSVSVLPEEQLDARLDEILAKIAREGRGSLSEEEQWVLEEASRRARHKRSDRL